MSLYISEVSKMSKQEPSIEWVVAESDADWEQLRAQPLHNIAAAPRSHQRSRRYGWSIVTLILTSVAGLLWHTHQATLPTNLAQPSITIRQKLKVVAQADRNLSATLLANAPAAHIDMTLSRI